MNTKSGLRAITVEMIPALLKTMGTGLITLFTFIIHCNFSDLVQDKEDEEEKNKSRREKKKDDEEEDEDENGERKKVPRFNVIETNLQFIYII